LLGFDEDFITVQSFIERQRREGMIHPKEKQRRMLKRQESTLQVKQRL